MELRKFLDAQECWVDIVKSELKSKKKVSHWIWFIFPQLRGLGQSPVSNYYGLDGLQEAKEYYQNKCLRKNLNNCLSIVARYKNIGEIKDCLGELDTMKLHSCVSLFYLATSKNIFKHVIKKFFNGVLDEKTILLLERRGDYNL